jgi:asparaginyl-tRNA synthetase
MLGVYDIDSGKIKYVGNKCTDPIADIAKQEFSPKVSQALLDDLQDSKHSRHLHNIDNAVFQASVDYFRTVGADWCNLPLTTKMISSPGEVYAGKQLDYTTDALPVTLEWFEHGTIFLAESSQFYLELRLLIENLDKVFSVYNSFRKEPADFSHLAEFQHIEFEGKVTFEENISIYIGLLSHITNYIVEHNYDDLAYYLSDEEINELKNTFELENILTLTFNEAMKILYDNLKDPKYKELSLKHFGSYEEVALTRIVGKHCNVIEFPVEEIPFYHDASFKDENGRSFAKNADLILLGYRETVGSGQRITDIDAIREKAKFFNLPEQDYEPYIELRNMERYQTTCGFGLGWQRYVQWLLKLPYIWEASHIPRGHHEPRP